MMEINKRLQALNRKKADKNEKKRAMEDRLTKMRQHQNSAGQSADDQGPRHRSQQCTLSMLITMRTKHADTMTMYNSKNKKAWPTDTAIQRQR